MDNQNLLLLILGAVSVTRVKVVSAGLGERIGLIAILVLATVVPMPVLAQTGVVVAGRVFEFGSRSVIWNARVELEGHGATLTSVAGTFRFDDVEPGGYALRVDAFGYDSDVRELVVEGATTVLVPLRVAPLPLDSLVVEARQIDIEGRVRDPEKDLLLVDAEVLTDQRPGTLTDTHGRFKLEDVLEDVPLHVMVRAFGYLRVDTIILPNKDESYVFEPKPDPWVVDMIADQIGLIEERSAGLLAVGRRPMDRESLLKYAGTHTLGDAIDFEYFRGVQGIACVFLDEELQDFLPLEVLLQGILPERLERIEVLFGGAMLRVYTREFMQDLFDLVVELHQPFFFQPPFGEPICR